MGEVMEILVVKTCTLENSEFARYFPNMGFGD
jgi:hypothetical protein